MKKTFSTITFVAVALSLMVIPHAHAATQNARTHSHANGGYASGKVTEIDASYFLIQTNGKNPVTKTVDFDQNTHIASNASFVFAGSKAAEGTVFDPSTIAVDDEVMVRGTVNQDGSIQATTVRIAPKVAMSFFKKHKLVKKIKGN